MIDTKKFPDLSDLAHPLPRRWPSAVWDRKILNLFLVLAVIAAKSLSEHEAQLHQVEGLWYGFTYLTMAIGSTFGILAGAISTTGERLTGREFHWWSHTFYSMLFAWMCMAVVTLGAGIALIVAGDLGLPTATAGLWYRILVIGSAAMASGATVGCFMASMGHWPGARPEADA